MSILVRNVSKRFGDFVALDDVARRRERLADRAPRAERLGEVDPPPDRPDAADTGEILLSGKDATALTPQKRNVGFVFQHYAAFKHMTVRDNIAFGLKVRKRLKRRDPRAGRRAPEPRAAPGPRPSLPGPALHGQRQRMGLAARSRLSRRCSSSTSRSARSTLASAPSSASGSGSSTTSCT